MEIVTVFVFILGLSTTYGLKCGDISGKWQNELGSRMLLNVDASNQISGEYYTAVETEPGAAAFTSNITGIYSSQGDGSLLAFSVLFNHGSSLTSWVGQCTVCDGKEVLHTSYVFRKYTQHHHERWASIIVNQNTFYRLEEESEDELANTVTEAYYSVRTRSVVSNKQPGGLELNGKWKSGNKEEIEVFAVNGDILKGKHHSTDLIGRKDGNDKFTAVILMSSASKRIRSWTGYIYDTHSTAPKVLETSWLEHEYNPSCTIARNGVRFGAENFTRAAEEIENNLKKSETFLDKIRKFFSSMF